MSDAEMPPETGSTLVRLDDGAAISVRRWGPPAAERVIISHGNGLAIDGFARFGAALVERGFEVIAFDMRNHGRNPFTQSPLPNWKRFIRDTPQILQGIEAEFDAKPSHGAFHSLSAVACLMSQAESGYSWRTLTVFEPPIMAAAESPLAAEFYDYHVGLSERAARRRSRFGDPSDLAVSMRRSSLFRLVSDEDLDRLARATTRPDGQGGFTLCCPPAFEAETFRNDAIVALRAGLSRIEVPVRVVLGDREIHYATPLVDAGRALAGDFGFERLELRGTTHFMQLERPDACARLVAGAAPLSGDLKVAHAARPVGPAAG